MLLKQHIMKKVVGNISISYNIECPHCEYYIDDWHDREWWSENIFDEHEGGEHEVCCPECKQEFVVEHFEQ